MFSFLDAKDSMTAEVRDHIEKLVESLVGDGIDKVSVTKICQHPSCKNFLLSIRNLKRSMSVFLLAYLQNLVF